MTSLRSLTLGAALALTACGTSSAPESEKSADKAPEASGATPEEAAAFISEVDAGLRKHWVESARAAWTHYTDITDEHAEALTKAEEASMAYQTEVIKESAKFNDVEGVDPDVARQIKLLQVSTSAPAPSDADKRQQLATIMTKMAGDYGKGKYCPSGDPEGEDCMDLGALEAVLSKAAEGDYDAQLEAWKGWRTISPPMRADYQQFVELTNQGAEEIGYADVGELWRSGYDMDPTAFDAEVERLWQQVKPLYEQLHCHVRAELNEKYGDDKVAADGKIPAHLLGNMWAQSWENLYPMLTPYPDEPKLDVTKALQEKGYDHVKMVKTAESFFTSLGLDNLPETFWERSMFLKPEDKDVVCHASAWDVELNDDLRIKMCIKIDHEDLITIHHELGHNYYYHYYYTEPVLFQSGAHDGFHEGVGDTLALSITPGYLKEIGILDSVSETEQGLINKQMQDALQKVAFFPFGRMIDKWRWGVFSGDITPENYNAAWWQLREEYQGIEAPIERTEADFDPGAKYHIPANTPYMRYFLAHILQFQFHKSLCQASGHEGPLHTCSIYGSKEAGAKLQEMLSMGASKPWPDALEVVTGTRKMDAGPMLEYFAPLADYLNEQNEGRTCGW